MSDNKKLKFYIDDLNKKQIEIANSIIITPASTTKYHIIRASRQSGKTFLLIRLAVYLAMLNENQKGAVISASFLQFNKLWREILEYVSDNNFNKGRSIIKHTDKSVNIISFTNGSTLQFFTARHYDSIVGNTFDFLLADEVALYPKDALSFITPVLAAKKDSKAIFASTPRGKNEFYNYCMRGLDKSQTFYKEYRMSYLDNNNYDLREVEEKRLTMPDSIFRSEYLAEFVFGNSPVFGEFAKHQTVNEWQPAIPSERYYAGIDVAGTGEDSTVLVIMNAKGIPVYIFEPQSESLVQQADELIPILQMYNQPFTKVECNGMGIGLYDILNSKVENINKFFNNNDMKNELVMRMKLGLNNSQLFLPNINLYPKLDSEMVSYVTTRTNTGKLSFSHEKNFHDDALDAFMIANLTREQFIFGSDMATYVPEPVKQESNIPTHNQILEYSSGLYDYED